MTRIAERKTIVVAETNARYRGRTLVVRLGSHEIEVREKGRRRWVAVPYLAVLEAGLKLAAREARRAKIHA